VVVLLAACSGSGTAPSGGKGGIKTSLDTTRDDLGRRIYPPPNVQRVVAMSPTIVELLFAVGATPVGRPSSANYPEAAKDVPGFGTSYQPSYEEIAAMRPDLIIADAIIDAGPPMDALVRLGAPVFALRVTSFEEVVRGLRLVGQLVGKKDAGEAEAEKLEAQFDRLKSKLPEEGPSFLVLVSAGPGQFIAEKDGSYLANILRLLKARNLVTSEPDNFRFPGFTDYSPERIVEKNPDVIITMSLGGPPGTPRTSDALRSSPALSSLRAVREGRVYEVDPVIYLESAGPRVSRILDELPRLLYPSVFAAGR
jgi:iron complex transport system substrate-binding protein